MEREKNERAWIQISEDQSDSLVRGYTEAAATNSFSHIRALDHLSAGIISSYLHVTKRGIRISSALQTSSQLSATMMGKFKSMHDKCMFLSWVMKLGTWYPYFKASAFFSQIRFKRRKASSEFLYHPESYVIIKLFNNAMSIQTPCKVEC